MADVRVLSNPPIREAIIDFRVLAADDRPASALLPLVESLKPFFPDARAEENFEALITAGGPAPIPAARTRRSLNGYVLRDADNRNVCSIKRDQFAFGFVRHYEGWEALAAATSKYFGMYVDFWKPKRITRVGVRFINVLPIQTDDDVELGDYLPCAPRTPAAAPQGLMSFNDVQDLVDLESGICVRVRQMAAAPKANEDNRSFIIDTDTFKIVDLDASFDMVQDLLVDLRKVKNNVFFGMVSDLALRPYE
jgi:uncharacterized protein (TIGR04255 family)